MNDGILTIRPLAIFENHVECIAITEIILGFGTLHEFLNLIVARVLLLLLLLLWLLLVGDIGLLAATTTRHSISDDMTLSR